MIILVDNVRFCPLLPLYVLLYNAIWPSILEPRVHRKQPLYLFMGRVKVCMHPPSPDPTCGSILNYVVVVSWSPIDWKQSCGEVAL